MPPAPRDPLSDLGLFAKKALVFFGILAALAVAFLIKSVLAVLGSAALAAAVLAPAVDSMERRRVPSWLAISLAYLVVLGVAALVAFTVVPLVADSAVRLVSLADGWLQSLQDWVASLAAHGGSKWAKEVAKQLSANNVLPFLREHLAGLAPAAGAAFGLLAGTVSMVVSALLAAVLCFIILLERRAAWAVLLDVLPAGASAYLQRRAPRLVDILKGWLRGQALVGLSVAASIYGGLWILEAFGLSFDSKLNLAVVTGMLIFLPYVGFTVALLPAAALALSMGGWGPVLGVAAVYGGTQLLESNLITPYVMGRSLDVSPLLTFVTLLVMVTLLGIPGAILAAPASAVAALLYADFVPRRK